MHPKIRRIAFVVAAVMALTTIAVNPVGADPTPGRCLEPGQIAYEFSFDHTRIVSGQSPSDAYTVALPTVVPGGFEYQIFAHTYDGYDGRVADGDAVERLIIDFLDVNGDIVESTAATTELSNGSDEAQHRGTVGIKVFRVDAVSVRVRHLLDNTGADAATGLGLVCVSLRTKRSFPDLTTTTSTVPDTTSSTIPDTTTTEDPSTTTTTEDPSTTTTTEDPSTTTTTEDPSTTTTTEDPSTTTTTEDPSTTTTTEDPSTTTTTEDPSTTTTTEDPSTTTTTEDPSTTTTTEDPSTTTTTEDPSTTTTTEDPSTTTTTEDPSTTTTTVVTGGPTTSTTTVPQVSPPEIEPSDPADPVDGVPTFTG